MSQPGITIGQGITLGTGITLGPNSGGGGGGGGGGASLVTTSRITTLGFAGSALNRSTGEVWSPIYPVVNNQLTIGRYNLTTGALLGTISLNSYFGASGQDYGSLQLYYDTDENCFWAVSQLNNNSTFVESCLYKIDPATGTEITHRLFTDGGQFTYLHFAMATDPAGDYKGPLMVVVLTGANGTTYNATAVQILDKSSLAMSKYITLVGGSWTSSTIPRYGYIDNSGYYWTIVNQGSSSNLYKYDFNTPFATSVFQLDNYTSLNGFDPSRNNLILQSGRYSVEGYTTYLFSLNNYTYGGYLPVADYLESGAQNLYDSHRDWIWAAADNYDTGELIMYAFNASTLAQVYSKTLGVNDNYYAYPQNSDATYPAVWIWDQGSSTNNVFEILTP
jgi:hypothetical protein